MIEESDWNTILAGSDVNKAAENWSDHFLAIMEQCIPQRYLRKRPNLPWLTKHIIQLIRRRNILFKRAKKTRKATHTLPSIEQLGTRLLVLFDITKSYISIIWHRLEAKCFGNPLNYLIKIDKLYHHFIVTTK